MRYDDMLIYVLHVPGMCLEIFIYDVCKADVITSVQQRATFIHIVRKNAILLNISNIQKQL